MKKVNSILLIMTIILSLNACGQAEPKASVSASMQMCVYCEELVIGDAMFCSYCGKKLDVAAISVSEAILGTWVANDDTWGRYEYSFYSDGSCIGTYHGGTGSVEPSLYPGAYYEGCGDGNWYFVQGALVPLLKVSYKGDKWGDHSGTMQYEYEFNEDYTKLKIYGVDTYGDRNRGSIVWTKID